MDKLKIPTRIIVALLLGSVAAYLVARWVGIGGSSRGPMVIIASSVIEPGSVVTAVKMKAIPWPTSEMPPGSFSDVAKLEGRIAKQLIYPGEAILDNRVAALDSKGGLSSIITPGKRAITVRVNDIVGVAGFTLPGSFVDILVNARDASGQPYSKTILNNVKVLAIAQETIVDQTKPKVVNAVTLELSPEESEQLDLARSIGSLSLVLRNEFDNTITSSRGARTKDLISGRDTAATKADGITPQTLFTGVDEYRGTKKTEATQ